MLKSFSDLKKAEGVGETLKIGAGLVIGIAADMAVTCLFKHYIPVGKGMTRLMVRLGVFVLAMKAGEDAENYFHETVDSTKDAYEKMKEEAWKAAKEIADRDTVVTPQ